MCQKLTNLGEPLWLLQMWIESKSGVARDVEKSKESGECKVGTR